MQASPTSTDLPVPPQSERQLADAASALYADLKSQGYGSRQIVGLVTQVLGCVSAELAKPKTLEVLP